MKQYTLTQAIQIIESKFGRKVSMIELEDGSFRSFNYRLSGDKKNSYIRL